MLPLKKKEPTAWLSSRVNTKGDLSRLEVIWGHIWSKLHNTMASNHLKSRHHLKWLFLDRLTFVPKRVEIQFSLEFLIKKYKFKLTFFNFIIIIKLAFKLEWDQYILAGFLNIYSLSSIGIESEKSNWKLVGSVASPI